MLKYQNSTEQNNSPCMLEYPVEKKGIAKRSSNFLEIVDNGKRFEDLQNEYGFLKCEAQRILHDNQIKLGLSQSEVCIMNALIKFSAMASWKEGKPICTARNVRIAQQSGLSKGTVSNKLKSLEDKGLIYRTYNQYNQRVGVEPISLAPFGFMLPSLEDEDLMQWKLNQREQITGKKQHQHKIMITRDDKIQYQKETRSTYFSDELKALEGSSNNEPRSTDQCTNKYINKNNHVKKTIQKKEIDISSSHHKKTWLDKVWVSYDKLITNYKIEDPAIVQAFKERSPKMMHNACMEFLKNSFPDFNMNHLYKAIRVKFCECLWRVGLSILYSLHSPKIHSKLKYLGSLCRGESIIKIEDNIRLMTLKAKKFSMEILEEKLDLSRFNDKKDLFNLICYVTDSNNVKISHMLENMAVHGNTIFVHNNFTHGKLTSSSYARNLKIQLVNKSDLPKAIEENKAMEKLKQAESVEKLEHNPSPSLNLTKVIHADSWSDEIWDGYAKLIKLYHIQHPKILEAFEKRSPRLMYDVTIFLMKAHLPSFDLQRLNFLDTLSDVSYAIIYTMFSPNVLDKFKYLNYLCGAKNGITNLQITIDKTIAYYDKNIGNNDDLLYDLDDEITW